MFIAGAWCYGQVGNRSVRDRIATPYVDASAASTEAGEEETCTILHCECTCNAMKSN